MFNELWRYVYCVHDVVDNPGNEDEVNDTGCFCCVPLRRQRHAHYSYPMRPIQCQGMFIYTKGCALHLLHPLLLLAPHVYIQTTLQHICVLRYPPEL